MEKFVIVKKQKESDDFTGRIAEIKVITEIIRDNGTVCIHGAYGIGKTRLAHQCLKNTQYVELTNDLIKSGIFERIADTYTHILVDDIDGPMTTYKTRGALIIISNKIIEEVDSILLEPLLPNDFIKIGTTKFPMVSLEKIKECAKQSAGNIRNFLFALENFSCKIDNFKSPKDFLYDLVCSDSKTNPFDYINTSIVEHGYSWGIIHENYMSSKNVKDLSKLATLADCMSIADIKDVEMYTGYSHTSIFSFFGIILPAITINHTLQQSEMKPGSAWTKYNNYKMRYSRFSSLTNRKFKTTVDVDFLHVLATYCKTKPVSELMPMLNTYGIESADMDMLNHILLINKIKTKNLQTIKKQLKDNGSKT